MRCASGRHGVQLSAGAGVEYPGREAVSHGGAPGDGTRGARHPGTRCGDHSERGGDPSRSESRRMTGKPVGMPIAHPVPFLGRGLVHGCLPGISHRSSGTGPQQAGSCRTKDSGRQRRSADRRTLLVNPPRERPSSTARGRALRRRRRRRRSSWTASACISLSCRVLQPIERWHTAYSYPCPNHNQNYRLCHWLSPGHCGRQELPISDARSPHPRHTDRPREKRQRRPHR